MSDKSFVDTNLLIYSISSDPLKSAQVESLFRDTGDLIISTQVVSEFVHTCHRKKLLPAPDIQSVVEDFLLFFELHTVGESTIFSAFDVKTKLGYSWYDSLIIAAALESDCSCLFSEDLQHGQVIEGRLTIQNPFVAHRS